MDARETHENAWRPASRPPRPAGTRRNAAEIARLRARELELAEVLVCHPYWTEFAARRCTGRPRRARAPSRAEAGRRLRLGPVRRIGSEPCGNPGVHPDGPQQPDRRDPLVARAVLGQEPARRISCGTQSAHGNRAAVACRTTAADGSSRRGSYVIDAYRLQRPQPRQSAGAHAGDRVREECRTRSAVSGTLHSPRPTAAAGRAAGSVHSARYSGAGSVPPCGRATGRTPVPRRTGR